MRYLASIGFRIISISTTCHTKMKYFGRFKECNKNNSKKINLVSLVWKNYHKKAANQYQASIAFVFSLKFCFRTARV